VAFVTQGSTEAVLSDYELAAELKIDEWLPLEDRWGGWMDGLGGWAGGRAGGWVVGWMGRWEGGLVESVAGRNKRVAKVARA
jgi:hypothetical protein